MFIRSEFAVKFYSEKFLAFTVAYAVIFYFNPTGIYLLKVNNSNTRTRREMCLKITLKTPERRQWRRSSVFIVNFEHV